MDNIPQTNSHFLTLAAETAIIEEDLVVELVEMGNSPQKAKIIDSTR